MGKLRGAARPQDDGRRRGRRGALTFVDNTVDVTTGTIKLKGTFPNADHKLGPASSCASCCG